MSDIQKRGTRLSFGQEMFDTTGVVSLIPDILNRSGHWESTPKPKRWLKARKVFAKRWDALITEGEANGFIDLEVDGGYYLTTDKVDRRWVADD